MTRLTLPDAEALADLATFAGRAHAIAPNGSIRLLAADTALACQAGILDGDGLFGEGVVIGLRVLALAEPTDADLTVTTARLLDAVRELPDGATSLDLDADPVPPRWVAQSPPRGGWEALGMLDTEDLREASRSRDVQAQVEGLPRGITHAVALAMRGLGLLAVDGEQHPVLYRSGPWLRLSTPLGHVLTR